MSARERMRTGWAGATTTGAMIVGTLCAAPSVSAQRPRTPAAPEPPKAETRDCRCVDGQGKTQDDCFCFSMPRVAINAMGALGRRAVLGVNVRTDQPSRYDAQGARLYGVDPESAAGKAGLEEGDVLARVDGKSLTEPLADKRTEDRLDADGSLPVQRLLSILSGHDAGDTLRVEYLRDGARKNATVVLGRGAGARAFTTGPQGNFELFTPGAPGSIAMLKAMAADSCPHGDVKSRRIEIGIGRSCVAGVEMLDMQPALAEYFGAKEGGVLISDADTDNPLGLRPGDVLLAVDGRDVRTVDRALRALHSYDNSESIALRVLRKQQTLELKGKLR